mgnify:CR=1 FL=1
MVMPFATIDCVIPVNDAVLLVMSAIVPAVEPEDERSSKVPVVVEVSTEEDERRRSDPPAAITEVVCGMMRAVPVVSALAVIVTPEPATSLTVVIPSTEPVDDAPENPPVRLANVPV